MNTLTKLNGTKLKVTSKAKVGVKINPRFRLGTKQKNNLLCFISFKKENVFVKEKITQITYYPIPKYVSKKYMIKNTIVRTESGSLVRIMNLNQGRILGQVIS
jgi:ribosomal protein S8E